MTWAASDTSSLVAGPAPKPKPPTLLFITPGFGVGGAQVRTTQIINALGPDYRYQILALNGNTRAGDRIDPSIPINWLNLRGTENPAKMLLRLVRLVRECRPDLVLSFNWGSIDAVLATVLAGICPVIHTEDGLNEDEALRQKRRRIWFRRLVLPHAHRVIAPSKVLEGMMRDSWHLPSERIQYLPNGVDTEKFKPQVQTGARSRIVVGTVGTLTAVKQQDRLIEVAARLKDVVPMKLVLVGDGPDRRRLENQARALGCDPVIEFWGHQQDTSEIYRQFDIFVLSSGTEQMPLSVLEAMASGLPVVSTNVGDVRQMVSEANRPHIVNTMAEFDSALVTMIRDSGLRRRLGQANRARCVREFGLQRMCETYASLYGQALESTRHR
jgi:glycosyltransferase involved in cell wall biosynthesis